MARWNCHWIGFGSMGDTCPLVMMIRWWLVGIIRLLLRVCSALDDSWQLLMDSGEWMILIYLMGEKNENQQWDIMEL